MIPDFTVLLEAREAQVYINGRLIGHIAMKTGMNAENAREIARDIFTECKAAGMAKKTLASADYYSGS